MHRVDTAHLHQLALEKGSTYMPLAVELHSWSLQNKPIEEATDHFWRALFSYDKSNLEQANSTSLSFDWHPSQMLLIADIDAN